VNYLNIGFYFILLSVGIFSVILSIRMNNKYRIGYLAYFLYFLIGYLLTGVLDLASIHLAPDILNISSSVLSRNIYILFGFIAFPLIPVCLYMFFLFTFGILEMRLSIFFKRTFILSWLIMYMGFIIGISILLNSDSRQFFARINIISMILLVGFIVFLITKIVLGIIAMKEKKKQLAFRNLFVIYLFIFVFLIVLSAIVGDNAVLSKIIKFLFFSLHIPPILYLKRFLRKYFTEHPIKSKTVLDLESFSSHYGISKREQEIVLLLLEGKSNQDIEDELFISFNTVRNHVYNIYQKLGIKSRIQLSVLINNFFEKQTSP